MCCGLEARYLFSQRPRLHFSPATTWCQCGSDLILLKTQKKTLATLTIGPFEALETQRHCRHCGVIYRSEELRSLTPHRGQFGFDVIEYIGRALFVQCHNARAVQAALAARNISISSSEIGFLGKRFIVYLALAHRACQAELRQHMAAKGGYILHLDGTCEGDSPQLFSCIDEISKLVLGNRKMPTEHSQHIIPLLSDLKSAYGTPLALMHDMGRAILKAVATVFPGIPDYICHFHFLRDLGKDLFGFEYRTIRRYTRTFKVKATLGKVEKVLRAVLNDDADLSANLHTYLGNNQLIHRQQSLSPWVTAYLLVVWVLEAGSACDGFGFPFDRPHLAFYQRLREAYPVLKRLKAKGVSVLPLAALQRVWPHALPISTSNGFDKKNKKITAACENILRICAACSGYRIYPEKSRKLPQCETIAYNSNCCLGDRL